MPLTCNAVGDILALIELGIVIAKFLNDCRGAPAECRALCNELSSLERLLALSNPTILALRDESVRELVEERLEIVSAHVDEGIRLIAGFGSTFDVSAVAGPAQNRRPKAVRWAAKTLQSVKWTLRRSADAKACRAIIAQSFEPLIFSLLVAFQADQKAILGVLQAAFTELTDEVKANYATVHDLAAGQEALRVDTLCLKELFERHLLALHSVREEVSSVRAQFTDALAAACLDIADIRSRFAALCDTTVTSTDISSKTQAVVNAVARESASTRAMLETHFLTISDGRLTDRGQLADIESKLNQVMKLLVQQAATTSNSDLIQHWRFPGMQQLRVASLRVQKVSSMLLPVISRAALSEEKLVTPIVLAMTARSSFGEVAYRVTAFLLAAARKASRLYKTPAIAHVVFVEDFFGFALEIPASKCANPQDFHAALVENFEGRMGFVFIRRRKYQLELVDSSISTQQTLPWAWERPLEPGARVNMNTYVRRLEPDVLRCPACSAQVTDPDELSVLDRDWIACKFCRTMVQVSRQETTRVVQEMEPLSESSTGDTGNRDPPTSSMRYNLPTSSDNSVCDSEEQAALRRCRRIRVIEQTLFERVHQYGGQFPGRKMELPCAECRDGHQDKNCPCQQCRGLDTQAQHGQKTMAMVRSCARCRNNSQRCDRDHPCKQCEDRNEDAYSEEPDRRNRPTPVVYTAPPNRNENLEALYHAALQREEALKKELRRYGHGEPSPPEDTLLPICLTI